MLNYEILSIRRKLDAFLHLEPGSIYNVTDFHPKIGARLSKFHTNHVSFDGKFNPGRDSIQYILHNFDIYSVKRLSDGEVFTIGNVITLQDWNRKDEITYMKPIDDAMCVGGLEFQSELNLLIKQQELSYAKQLHDYQRKYNEAMKEMNEYILSQYPLTVHDAFYLNSPKKLLLLL